MPLTVENQLAIFSFGTSQSKCKSTLAIKNKLFFYTYSNTSLHVISINLWAKNRSFPTRNIMSLNTSLLNRMANLLTNSSSLQTVSNDGFVSPELPSAFSDPLGDSREGVAVILRRDIFRAGRCPARKSYHNIDLFKSDKQVAYQFCFTQKG